MKLTAANIKKINRFLDDQQPPLNFPLYEHPGTPSWDYGSTPFKRHLYKSYTGCGMAEFKEAGKVLDYLYRLTYPKQWTVLARRGETTVHGRIRVPDWFIEQALIKVFKPRLDRWDYTAAVLFSDQKQGNCGRLMQAAVRKYPELIQEVSVGINPNSYSSIYLWIWNTDNGALVDDDEDDDDAL